MVRLLVTQVLTEKQATPDQTLHFTDELKGKKSNIYINMRQYASNIINMVI